MTDSEPLDDPFDDYLNGTLDDARARELEARLQGDVEARRAFIRYVRLHTDLLLELRARQASGRVLDLIGKDLAAAPPQQSTPRRSRPVHRLASLLAATAVLVLAVWAGWRLLGRRAAPDAAVAWLVNAQNCTWTDGEPPGDLRPGRSVRVDRGLAELRFRCGTRMVIEGPAHIDLVSD